MSNNTTPMGVKNPVADILTENEFDLGYWAERQLRAKHTEILLEVKKRQAQQDGISAVHLYTLLKVDQTLTAAAVLTALRSPCAPDKLLDELAEALDAEYIRAIQHVALKGTESIVNS